MSLLSLNRFGLIIIMILLGNHSSLAGVEDSAATCQGCHGLSGNSKIPQYPSLAGQRASYIEKQLNAFKNGQRTGAVMQGVVTKLSQKEMTELAAYFSKLPPKSAGGNADLAAKGKAKAAMCMGCHGSNGQGQGNFPRLAGQQPEYLKKQLMNFKHGHRKGGPMNYITASLSDADIAALSAYFGTLD